MSGIQFEDLKEFLDKIKTVNTRCGELDLVTLYTYAHNVPENGVIVDIGTFMGSSAFSMAMGSHPSVKVYTIDPFLGEHDQFYTKRKEFGLEDRVIENITTGEELSKTWDKPIDMLFIDAIHSDTGVQNDLKWFGKYVKKGGFILAHDYYLYNGIKWAIDESVKEGFMEEVEILDSVDTRETNGRVMGMFVGRKL